MDESNESLPLKKEVAAKSTEMWDPNDFALALKENQKNIPGVETVDIAVMPKDATHCLVHIRQIHTPSPGLSQEDFEDLSDSDDEQRAKIWKDLVRTQTDIHFFLAYLSREMGIGTVMLENTTDKNLEEALQLTGTKRRLLKNYHRGIIDSTFLGARELVMKGLLKPLPAEEQSTFELAQKILAEKGRESPEFHEAQNQRELKVITKIASSNNKVVPLLFGMNHDFRDMVEKWNVENPNNKVTLIVVTPKTLPKP